MSINDLYEIAADYYENQLKTNASKEVSDFILDNQWSDALLQKFRIGYAEFSSKSFYQYMKGVGFEEDCLVDSGLVRRGKNGELSDVLQDALIFPIIRDENVIEGFGARFMGLHGQRYMNVYNNTIPKDERLNIFGLNASVVSERNSCIICEGYLDVIAMHNIGLTQTIALLPLGDAKKLVAKISPYTKNVFLAFDNDAFGKHNADIVRNALELSEINVWEINLRQYKDSYEYIKFKRKQILNKSDI